ncbi:hypothetical protein [Reinekea blandensis]|uniref:Uncharacterized protein n=1 Tax=Reinekea blandensis MED297 TaxID=314283 RepID=A4BJ81_9GAMM|nr:hypothetical protein [Reinekea blandensis]EAR07834.1 hypothetical protein MED297_05299 [Reinekea sp. MED297] [Reinekea blandensis MED297]
MAGKHHRFQQRFTTAAQATNTATSHRAQFQQWWQLLSDAARAQALLAP